MDENIARMRRFMPFHHNFGPEVLDLCGVTVIARIPKLSVFRAVFR
jgi:hypothetical protein